MKMILTGNREVDRMLVNLGMKRTKPLHQFACEHALIPARQAARSLTRPRRRTGKLSGSARIAGYQNKKGAGAVMEMGAEDAFYASFLEFGWRPGRRSHATKWRYKDPERRASSITFLRDRGVEIGDDGWMRRPLRRPDGAVEVKRVRRSNAKPQGEKIDGLWFLRKIGVDLEREILGRYEEEILSLLQMEASK